MNVWITQHVAGGDDVVFVYFAAGIEGHGPPTGEILGYTKGMIRMTVAGAAQHPVGSQRVLAVNTP